MDKLSTGWNKHKKVVINGAQIITIITLLGGLVSNYYSTNQNTTAIGTSSQWMKDAIKGQSTEITDLRIDNAVLTTKYDSLKERVESDEALIRSKEQSQ